MTFATFQRWPRGSRTASPGAADPAPDRWAPAVDVIENAERFVIRADVPGVDPKEIEVRVADGVLSLSGQRDAPATRGFHCRERGSGRFARRFALPPTADGGAVSARGSHGVLEITIAKRHAAKARRIEVN